MDVLNQINALEKYLESEGYKGWDPYDVLNSKYDLLRFGKLPAAVFTQIQKRNPINIRQLLKIEKDFNSKAMGLFLSAYSKLYRITGKDKYKEKADWFFSWLKQNHSEGFKGLSWGYNFGWANPGKVVPRYSPNIVVTGFIAKGLFEYEKSFNSTEVVELTENIIAFIENHLEVTEDETGLCYSYTTIAKDKVYNASLQAGEIFAWYASKTNKDEYKRKALEIADFVVARQEKDGSWAYSENADGSERRKQLDFHQGYVIESLEFIAQHTNSIERYSDSIKRGFDFYKEYLVLENGQSIYRYPTRFPTDIHNQAQAIITFSSFGSDELAEKALDYTLNKMKSPIGFFYYKRYPFFAIKTPYIRWSQAWMFLAMATFLEQNVSRN